MFEQLEIINTQIERIAKLENKGYYFGRFLPNRDINTNIIFVGEKPTMPKKIELWNPKDNFNLSKSDLNFIETLNKYGLGGSYITDIIKSCGPSGDILTRKDLDIYFPILLEEINVIKPKIIVALSKNTEDILRREFLLNNVNIQVCAVYHPSYVQRYNKQKQFEEQIREISGLVKNFKK